GRPNRRPGLDAAAGHPDRKRTWMVIAAVIVGRQLALRVDGPAEFARPNDECVVYQAVLLQVLNQPGVGLVGVLGVAANVLRQPRVMVPGAMIELNEPDAPL